jgi:hypothetical protein
LICQLAYFVPIILGRNPRFPSRQHCAGRESHVATHLGVLIALHRSSFAPQSIPVKLTDKLLGGKNFGRYGSGEFI